MFLTLFYTIVFILLAAYCYSKSSERFHTWLLNNSWCGEYIRNYKSGKGITVRQKISTIAMLWLSISFSMWYVSGAIWFNLLMLAIASGVTAHLLLIKTCVSEDAAESQSNQIAPAKDPL